MSSQRWTLKALSATAALAVVACGANPPPQPVEPKPIEATVSPPPAPNPMPKLCAALDEECSASESTRAKIAGGPLFITPAKGWTYAQTATATLAQASDKGPGLAVVQGDFGDGKQDLTKREAALETLGREIKVTLPKKKVAWKKPDETKEVAGMKVGLWQAEGGTRADKKGPLLIFAAVGKDGTTVLGLGFVPEDDTSGADATILQSIESIGASGE